MKYVRTKDGITTSDRATHELIESICDAGYFKTLEKGAYVRIGETWWNYYGNWTSIIDENGMSYDIRPNEVENVVKELPSADTIEELIQDNDILYIHDLYPDAVLVVEGNIKPFGYNEHIKLNDWLKYKNKFDLYIRDSKNNYIYVAKMNDKGELELL